jgi:hypothetical protein
MLVPERDRRSKLDSDHECFPKSHAELAKAVVEITSDIRTQYTVAFYPQSSDTENRYHQLRVTVRGGRYTVSAGQDMAQPKLFLLSHAGMNRGRTSRKSSARTDVFFIETIFRTRHPDGPIGNPPGMHRWDTS